MNANMKATRAYVEQLENKVKSYEAETAKLQERIEELEAQNEKLMRVKIGDTNVVVDEGIIITKDEYNRLKVSESQLQAQGEGVVAELETDIDVYSSDVWKWVEFSIPRDVDIEDTTYHVTIRKVKE